MAKRIALVFGLFGNGPSLAAEKVVLQLHGPHAYQFAGYYMAREQGYYREQGLEVEIREGGTDTDVIREVLSRRAHYATGDSTLVLARSRGQPVVVLAVIFQHSPEVLVTRDEAPFSGIEQLRSRRLALEPAGSPAIATMLMRGLGSLHGVDFVRHDGDLSGLVQGRYDAAAALQTDQLFHLREQRLPITVLEPIQYGVDFYGDNFFTSEEEIRRFPGRVAAFRKASLQGWHYALGHPQETLAVLQHLGSRRSIEHLRYEYGVLQNLILPHYIELGHMDQRRWKAIADSYVSLGQLPQDFSLHGFLYDETATIDLPQFRRYVFAALAITFAAGLIIAGLIRFNRKLHREIEERHRAEQALALQQARLEELVAQRTAELRQRSHDLQTLLDNLPAVIAYWDRRLLNRFANKAHREWFGIDPAELPGRSLRESLPAAFYQASLPHIETVLEGEPVSFEQAFLCPQQTAQRHVQVDLLPDRQQNRVVGFYLMMFDVTRIRAAEAAVKAQEQRYRRALDSVQMGTWSLDLARDGRIHLDPLARQHLGLETSTLSLQEWQRMLHPEDCARAETLLRERLAADAETCRELHFECRIRRPDGDWRFLEISAEIHGDVLHSTGPAFACEGTSRDITARKRAEQALRESETVLRTLGNNLPGGFIYQMREAPHGRRRIQYISDSFEALAGVPAAAILADPEAFYSTLQPEDRERLHQAERECAANGETLSIEVRLLHRDGVLHWLNLQASPRLQPDGGVIWDGVAVDVSQRRQAEEQLRAAKEAAEAATAAKTTFLSNMSHEIRTPLNAILNLASILEGQALSVEQQTLVTKIRNAGRSLLNIINDILDLSKIEAGRMRIEQVPFALAQVLERVSDIMSGYAAGKDLRYTVDPVPSAAEWIYGDPLRLEQVLINLVGNAIKFTETGEVRVELSLVEPWREGRGLRVAVRDTGIGIEPGRAAALFSAFSQADSSTTRRFGGTGLGLAISQRLVELMGGEIGFESEIGQGSEFWFILPLRPAPAPLVVTAASVTPADRRPQRLAGMRILLVDDDEINLEVAQYMLEQEGATVTLASNGREALDRLRASPDEFDAVLLDVQMPVMDGYTAVGELRRDLGLTKLPVIALTAGTFDDQRDRALAAGMNGFIGKPFELDDVVATLSALAGRQAAPRAADRLN